MPARKPRIVVIYDTKTGHTYTMARLISDAIKSMGVTCEMYLAKPNFQIAWENVVGVALGSPTFNHAITINMQLAIKQIPREVLSHSVAGAFGSYSWSGESPDILNEFLETQNAKIVAGPLGVIQSPGPSDEKRCSKFGQRLAEAAKLLPVVPMVQ